MRKQIKIIALILLYSAFFTLPAFAVVLKPTNVNPKVLAEITTKNGKGYELREIYHLSHGVNSYTYEFGPIGKDEFLTIYSGKNYTDAENCPHDEYNKSRFNADTAMISRSIFKKDLNNDGVLDLGLSFIEKDCKSKKVTFISKFLLSSTSSFAVKEYKFSGDVE